MQECGEDAVSYVLANWNAIHFLLFSRLFQGRVEIAQSDAQRHVVSVNRVLAAQTLLSKCMYCCGLVYVFKDFKAFVPQFFKYTGTVRPHFVTPRRWVPDDIPKPEYAVSGMPSHHASRA